MRETQLPRSALILKSLLHGSESEVPSDQALWSSLTRNSALASTIFVFGSLTLPITAFISGLHLFQHDQIIHIILLRIPKPNQVTKQKGKPRKGKLFVLVLYLTLAKASFPSFISKTSSFNKQSELIAYIFERWLLQQGTIEQDA